MPVLSIVYVFTPAVVETCFAVAPTQLASVPVTRVTEEELLNPMVVPTGQVVAVGSEATYA